MNRIQKLRGFTLVELLVIVGVIGILTALLYPSYSSARLSAKDAAVSVALSSFRIDAELEYNGEFAGICEGDLFDKIESTVEGYGGLISECTEFPFEYRVIAVLPSAVAGSGMASGMTNVAYAQKARPGGGFGGGTVVEVGDVGTKSFSTLSIRIPNNKQFDAYCVNSRGMASLTALNNVPSLQTDKITSYIEAVGTIDDDAEPVDPGDMGGIGILRNLTPTAHAQTQVVISGGQPDFYCSFEEKAKHLNMEVGALKQLAETEGMASQTIL